MNSGIEAMSRIQQQAVHESLTRRVAALKRLKPPVDPLQLFVLQSELVREDAAQAARYWQEMSAAAMEAQSELAASYTRLISSESLFGPAATFGG